MVYIINGFQDDFGSYNTWIVGVYNNKEDAIADYDALDMYIQIFAEQGKTFSARSDGGDIVSEDLAAAKLIDPNFKYEAAYELVEVKCRDKAVSADNLAEKGKAVVDKAISDMASTLSPGQIRILFCVNKSTHKNLLPTLKDDKQCPKLVSDMWELYMATLIERNMCELTRFGERLLEYFRGALDAATLADYNNPEGLIKEYPLEKA